MHNNKNAASRPLRPDRLRWAIWLCLCAPTPLFAAGSLQPTTGPGGTPVVNQGHGVPVIDIVAPNPRGLSHNQFLDYNVGRAGLVLNNATQAGQSQLAGALAANPQFHGQAASTILNEVISRNASLIEGPQEIFGRAADYILANPNGITLNGGSFINTTQAGFLVGTPVIEDQRIKYLETLDAAGRLKVSGVGQSNLKGALDLIAPRIDSNAALRARRDLNLIAGRNRIDAASGAVLKHLPGTPSNIDASLFGAMRAGRIRIVSTAEGAGVRVGDAALQADDSLHLSSAGDLQLTGTQARARQIEAHAGQKLVLDAKARNNVKQDREAWDKGFLFVTTETYSRERTQTDRKHQGTQLQASETVKLDAKGDVQVTAATVKARKHLQLKSGGNITVDAAIDSSKVEEQVRHRKHLWRGDSDSTQNTESASVSTLEGGSLSAQADGNLRVTGSRLRSHGDLQLKARQVDIDPQRLKRSASGRDYRGDLASGTFFGKRNGDDRQATLALGSAVQAKGNLSIAADQVVIQGSRVKSRGDAVVYSEKAGLKVESAQSSQERRSHDSDSKLFGLIGSSSESTDKQQQVLVSDIRSDTNLRLASAAELKVHGANLAAGQKLQLDAKGDLNLQSAQSVSTSARASEQRYLTASARQTQQAEDGKPGSKQYAAKVGYEVAHADEKTSSTEQTLSTLSGASVSLNSGKQLKSEGAQVTATAGELTLKADRIALDAAYDRHDKRSSDTRSGGGLALTGGIDRVGSAFEGHRQQSTDQQTTSSAKGTALNAGGNLHIESNHLSSEGTSVKAGDQLLVKAGHIDNRAASNTSAREQTRNDWQGSLGASVEYRDISRPIERLVNGDEAARFQQPGIEDALAAPSVGADLNVEHQRRVERNGHSVAQVSRFNGASVDVEAGKIIDHGTDYKADKGTLQIAAREHQLNAASDRKSHAVERLAANGGLRVDTSTGSDINARLEGKGGTLKDTQNSTLARPGSLVGQTGIQVQLGSDGRYEGARLDAGDGSLKIASGGKLTLAAAQDHSRQDKTQLDASLWAKGGTRPGSQGVDVRGYGDYRSTQSNDSKARGAQIDGKGSVELSSAGDLTLEGSRIGSRDAVIGDVRLHSGGVAKVVAAHDTHQAKGGVIGGGLEVAASKSGKVGGGLGGHFTHGKTDQDARQAVNAAITSNGQLSITSTSRDDQAVQLQGLQADAKRIDIDAANGGVLIEASASQERRDNLEITAGAGFKLNPGETTDKDIRALHGRVQMALDHRDNQTWSDSTLRADDIALRSRGDTRIEGARLEAQRIDGKVAGDLLVASRKDRVDNLKVDVDARLSLEKNPQGHINAATALAGPAGAKVKDKAGKLLARSEPTLSPTLKVDVSHQQLDNVARQTALSATEGIDLAVAGDTHLSGARLQSTNGSVQLGEGKLTQQDLRGHDYRRDVGFNVSNAPVDLGTAIYQGIKDKGAAQGDNPLNLGLLQTSGHSKAAQWTSKIEQKQK